MAWLAEAHASVTVSAGTVLGIPAASTSSSTSSCTKSVPARTKGVRSPATIAARGPRLREEERLAIPGVLNQTNVWYAKITRPRPLAAERDGYSATQLWSGDRVGSAKNADTIATGHAPANA